MTRTLDRIRVWANANYHPWWNIALTIAMMATALLAYELRAYQLAAIQYACATVPVMLATAHFAMRYEEMRQSKAEKGE